MRRTAALLAARPLARSMLVSRSPRLSPGGIAGAVVGSVVGALLLAFCLFPFVVRARRRRLNRHDDAPGLAEMGQGPGGPILVPSSPLDVDGTSSSYKAGSASGPDTGTASAPGHDHPATAATPTDLEAKSSLPHGVVVQHGLPSPVSSTPSPTDRPSRDDGQEAAAAAAAATTSTTSPTRSPTRSPTEAAPSLPRHESTRTVDRESTRDLSFTDSYGPPSRELTSITTVGITEEPESFDRPSGSPDSGPFPHLRESLRTLLHGRRSSSQQQQQPQEHESRRSTFADPTGSRWQPAPTNEAFVPQQEPLPSGLEIDAETPGLAWDYYHDPSLDIELADAYPQAVPTTLPDGLPLATQLPPTTLGADFPAAYSQPGQAIFPAAIIPPTQLPTSAPLGFGFPTGQFPLPQAEFAPAAIARPIPGDLDPISPNSDATLTPGAFGGQNILFQGKKFPGAPQRTDSLPLPTIISDLPSPPLFQYNAGPSANPMEMMKPTNQAESAWMLEHEMRMIHNSPPMPTMADPTMPMQMTTPSPGPALSPEVFTKPEPPSPYQQQPLFQTPYQSPPLAATDPGLPFTGLVEYYSDQLVVVPDQVAPSDYSTPPPSTGPSTENTPDTRLTPFTSSPSPAADMMIPTMNGHLTSPNLQAGLSPVSGLSASPAGSRAPSPSPSAGPSPGKSPVRPPGGFVCKDCGVVKDSYHQFNHHRRYHERKFPCTHPGCPRSFGTVTHLTRHLNDRHTKSRIFFCTVQGCDFSSTGTKSFPRKDNCKRHMMKKHHIDAEHVTVEEMNLADMGLK